MNKQAKRSQPATRVDLNPEPVDLDSVQSVLLGKIRMLEDQKHLSLADKILIQFAVKSLFANLKTQKQYQNQLIPLIERYNSGE